MLDKLWMSCMLVLVAMMIGINVGCNDGGSKDPYDTGGDTDTPIVDNDGDGWSEDDGDCNDNDADILPARGEDRGDGIDNNCDGGDYRFRYSDVDIYGGYNTWLVRSAAGSDYACYANPLTAGGDGVVSCLELQDSEPTLDTSNATITFTGDDNMALGIAGSVHGNFFCLGGGEFDDQRGKLACWDITVFDNPGDYTPTDAVFTITGENTGDYTDRHWFGDVTGDGSVDLLVSAGGDFWVFDDIGNMFGDFTLADANFSVEACPDGGCTLFVGESTAIGLTKLVYSDYKRASGRGGEGVLYAFDLPLMEGSVPTQIDEAPTGISMGLRVVGENGHNDIFYVNTGSGVRDISWDGSVWVIENYELGFSLTDQLDVGLDYFTDVTGRPRVVMSETDNQLLLLLDPVEAFGFQNAAAGTWEATKRVGLPEECGLEVFGLGAHIAFTCQRLGPPPDGNGGGLFHLEELEAP